MTLARLAGFDSIRITQVWAPGMTEPTADDVTALTNVVTAADLSGMRVFVTVMPFGSKTTPLGNDAQAQFAQFAARRRDQGPGDRGRDRRQRAEPEPLLAAAVQRGRHRRRRARLRDAARAAPTTRSRPSRPRSRSTAAPSRRAAATSPGTGRDTHSPTVFIKDMGAAYRASGRTEPIMDAYVQHVYEDNSSLPPGTQHPKHDVDLARRLRQARQAARHRVRRHRPARLDPADPLRRVRGRVADPGGQGQALHRHRAGDHEAGRRGDAGPLLQPGRPARVLPAERDGALPLPPRGRARARAVAVGRLLRQRQAEAEP